MFVKLRGEKSYAERGEYGDLSIELNRGVRIYTPLVQGREKSLYSTKTKCVGNPRRAKI